MLREEVIQHEEDVEKLERTTTNNESAEGATMMAEDGQEVLTGTWRSTRSTAGNSYQKSSQF